MCFRFIILKKNLDFNEIIMNALKFYKLLLYILLKAFIIITFYYYKKDVVLMVHWGRSNPTFELLLVMK